MTNLTNGQNFQIESKSERLRNYGITLKGYIFVSGHDKNSIHAKEVTAYGLQYATMITAGDNSKDVNEKKEAVTLVHDEIVMIDGKKYRTNYIGNYSDAVHFHEVA